MSPARCPIDTRVVVGKPGLEQFVQRRLGGLLERGGRLRPGTGSQASAATRARSPSRCCSPSDSTRFQCASSSRRPTRFGSPTAVNASAICAVSNVPGASGIAHRLRQRREREIRPLRHHHDPRALRHADGAAAERPDACDGTEQRRLAGAGRPRHQHAVAGPDRESLGRDQRLAIRQAAPGGRRS